MITSQPTTTTVWNVWSWSDGDRILDATFATKEAAEAYAGKEGREVEECDVLSAPPEPWHWWVRGAEVYPDKFVKRFSQKNVSDSPSKWLEDVDDHLNADRVWDGHTQGHCGEHIYISGTDPKAVTAAFRKRLAEALARQDGTCHDPHWKHEGDVDGKTVYDVGFLGIVRRAGSKETEKMECYRYFEHDWSAPPNANGGRSCRHQNCGSYLITTYATFTFPQESAVVTK